MTPSKCKLITFKPFSNNANRLDSKKNESQIMAYGLRILVGLRTTSTRRGIVYPDHYPRYHITTGMALKEKEPPLMEKAEKAENDRNWM